MINRAQSELISINVQIRTFLS